MKANITRGNSITENYQPGISEEDLIRMRNWIIQHLIESLAPKGLKDWSVGGVEIGSGELILNKHGKAIK